MYMLKAKKNLEQQDQKDFAEKRERFLDRQEKLSVLTAGGVDIDTLEDPPPPVGLGLLRGNFRPEDLPDGTCISPKKMTRSNPYENDGNTAVREGSYIGSFSVIGEDQNARAEYVRKQLMEMRNVTKTKPVLLVISLSGIKVCSSTGESVYMAHALKRISYATCDPEYCQFSFLAREPKGPTNIQYCHGFVTKTSQEAEELNAIVGNAFKMAFTHQRETQQQKSVPASTSEPPLPPESSPPLTHRQPTFHEMIEQQIEVQREQNEEIQRRQQQELTKRLSEISTAKVDERMRELAERRKRDKEDQEREQEVQRQHRLAGKDRTSWSSETNIV